MKILFFILFTSVSFQIFGQIYDWNELFDELLYARRKEGIFILNDPSALMPLFNKLDSLPYKNKKYVRAFIVVFPLHKQYEEKKDGMNLLIRLKKALVKTGINERKIKLKMMPFPDGGTYVDKDEGDVAIKLDIEISKSIPLP